METVSPEELIGAYFDGEATAEERQQAEKLLEQSQSARLWLAHLQRVHASLTALPRYKMPRDCADRVLRQAEQAMLADGSLRPVRGGGGIEATAADTTGGISRRQMWAVLAVAATALFVVVLPSAFRREAAQVAQETAGHTRAENHLSKLPDELPIAPTDGAVADVDSVTTERFNRDRRETAAAEGERLDRKTAATADYSFSDMAATAQPFNYFSKDGQAPAVNRFSYIYDVPTPEAQQTVLKKFEETLREQQIVLETAEKNGPSAQTAGGVGGGGFGAAAPDTAAGREAAESKVQPNAAQDRVYFIEATELQLSNTINVLDNYASTTTTSGRSVANEQKPGEPAPETGKEAARPGTAGVTFNGGRSQTLGVTREPSPDASASQAGTTAPIEGGYEVNRSQALRLQTDFDDVARAKKATPGQMAPVTPAAAAPAATTPVPEGQPKDPAADAPVAQKKAESGVPEAEMNRRAARGLQSKFGSLSRQLAEPSQQLQQAVIIFRVVPETPPAQPQK